MNENKEKIQKSIILESRLKVATFSPKSTCNRLFFRIKSIIQKVLIQATDERESLSLLVC
jgi:hypothetical protein